MHYLIRVALWLALCSVLSSCNLLPPSLRYTYTPGDSVDNVGYEPPQPIAFSHKLHAGDKGIPCQYCHHGARRSASAVIPPLNTCMGCHRNIATDREPIKYLTKMYKENKPVRWVKVHDLPDYARFSHKVHIVKGGLECQECHGAVETMEVVRQVAPLQMGWCIGCHRQKAGETQTAHAAMSWLEPTALGAPNQSAEPDAVAKAHGDSHGDGHGSHGGISTSAFNFATDKTRAPHKCYTCHY